MKSLFQGKPVLLASEIILNNLELPRVYDRHQLRKNRGTSFFGHSPAKDI